MDCLSLFKEKHIEDNDEYPRNDIGMAKLFFALHSKELCYVVEAKSWYTYTGRRWKKDESRLRVMERCKSFAQAIIRYAELCDAGDHDSKMFMKYVGGFHSRRRREGLLSDARSIDPKPITIFDRDKFLLNCQNGTYNLQTMTLQPHNPADYITKISRVEYIEGVVCERWERFIGEIMCGDADTAQFLQKALGYSLSGDTSLECFFILHGSTTRNGKSTLMEAVGNILGEYARTVQPQTLSRRPNDGSAAAPDTARLKGARLVKTSEPEKGLELNTALIKQFTGGDTYTARFLHENPVEFAPEFKIFINTNHLPATSDPTIFASGRVKLIPFDRHFSPEEQDTGLKKFFRVGKNRSGILNWLIEGYRLLLEEGLEASPNMAAAIAAYRIKAAQTAFDFGAFVAEHLLLADGSKVKTSAIYQRYQVLAQGKGWRVMPARSFVGELRERVEVKRDCALGNVVIGYTLKPTICEDSLADVSQVS